MASSAETTDITHGFVGRPRPSRAGPRQPRSANKVSASSAGFVRWEGLRISIADAAQLFSARWRSKSPKFGPVKFPPFLNQFVRPSLQQIVQRPEQDAASAAALNATLTLEAHSSPAG